MSERGSEHKINNQLGYRSRSRIEKIVYFAARAFFTSNRAHQSRENLRRAETVPSGRPETSLTRSLLMSLSARTSGVYPRVARLVIAELMMLSARALELPNASRQLSSSCSTAGSGESEREGKGDKLRSECWCEYRARLGERSAGGVESACRLDPWWGVEGVMGPDTALSCCVNNVVTRGTITASIAAMGSVAEVVGPVLVVVLGPVRPRGFTGCDGMTPQCVRSELDGGSLTVPRPAFYNSWSVQRLGVWVNTLTISPAHPKSRNFVNGTC